MIQKSPAFQFYPLDFLSDANVRLMTVAERGAYIFLLCHCWVERGLPDDVLKLAVLADCDAHCDVDFVTDTWPHIKHCFYKDDKGLLQNRRLDFEREKQTKYSKNMSKISKKRWDNRLQDMRTVSDAAKPTLSDTGKGTVSSLSLSSISPSSSNSNNKKHIDSRPKNFQQIVDVMKDQKVAQDFFDYYESNGWKVGKVPMKDWTAAARRWLRNAPQTKEKGTNQAIQKPVLNKKCFVCQEMVLEIDWSRHFKKHEEDRDSRQSYPVGELVKDLAAKKSV